MSRGKMEGAAGVLEVEEEVGKFSFQREGAGEEGAVLLSECGVVGNVAMGEVGEEAFEVKVGEGGDGMGQGRGILRSNADAREAGVDLDVDGDFVRVLGL